MAIASVQSVGAAPGSQTTTNLAYGSNNAAGNLLVGFFTVAAIGRTVTITDSQSNTWVLAKQQDQPTGGSGTYIYYALNSKAGANTVTFAISGAAAILRLNIHEYSGLALTGALDQTNSAQADSSTALNSGNITTTIPDELIFCGGYDSNIQTFTLGTNFVSLLVTPAAPNSRIATEHRIVSSTLTTAGTMSTDGQQNWACIVASFSAGGQFLGWRLNLPPQVEHQSYPDIVSV